MVSRDSPVRYLRSFTAMDDPLEFQIGFHISNAIVRKSIEDTLLSFQLTRKGA